MRNDPVPRYENKSDWRAPVPREEITEPEVQYLSVPWASIPAASAVLEQNRTTVITQSTTGTTAVPNWIIATLALSSGVAAGWFLRKLFNNYNDYRNRNAETSVDQRPFFNDYHSEPIETDLDSRPYFSQGRLSRQTSMDEGAVASRHASMGFATAVDDIKGRLGELERKAAISQWTSDLNISPFSPHRGGPPQYPFRHDFPRENRQLPDQNRSLTLPPGPDSNFRK